MFPALVPTPLGKPPLGFEGEWPRHMMMLGGRTDGRTEGHVGGWVGGRMDGRTEGLVGTGVGGCVDD